MSIFDEINKALGLLEKSNKPYTGKGRREGSEGHYKYVYDDKVGKNKKSKSAKGEDKKARGMKEILRLEHLLNEYEPVYRKNWRKGREHSRRMLSWMHQYNILKDDHPEAWEDYCKAHGWALDHNAGDVLA